MTFSIVWWNIFHKTTEQLSYSKDNEFLNSYSTVGRFPAQYKPRPCAQLPQKYFFMIFGNPEKNILQFLLWAELYLFWVYSCFKESEKCLMKILTCVSDYQGLPHWHLTSIHQHLTMFLSRNLIYPTNTVSNLLTSYLINHNLTSLTNILPSVINYNCSIKHTEHKKCLA